MRPSLPDCRASVLLLLLGGCVSAAAPAATQTPPGDWRILSPAAAGFQPNVAERLDEAVNRGELKNLHAVVVVRHGKLVFERYYEGPDQFWAMPIGTVKFGPGVKHDLRSATKSIVGLLYGIALSEGKVPGLDQSLIDQFPEFRELAADPKRRRMKVAHALTMTLGIDWPEDIPYTDSRNPELGMYLATDPYRFIFDRPMVAEPGSLWNYNGGATALLGHLIAQGTGTPLFQYAREKLFEPLGIVEVQWVGGTNGEVSAASGLRMLPRDFAKLGQLVLNRGRWGAQQVIPAEWLEQSFRSHAHPPAMDEGAQFDYGYQWWLLRPKASDHSWVAAGGNGGQRLFVIAGLDLVVAIMAGNYNAPDQSAVPMKVMTEIVLPALNAK